MKQSDQLLLQSAKNDNVEGVRQAIKDGADVNVVDTYGLTPLHLAQSIEIVQALLTVAEINVNALSQAGSTPLHMAANGRVSTVQALLSMPKINIHIQNNLGSIPLHNAVTSGFQQIITMLVIQGTNINVKNRLGQTPLYLACSFGRIATIKALLSVKDKDGLPVADVDALPIYSTTLMQFFQDDTPNHQEARWLLRRAGCAEIVVNADRGALEQFISDAQNTHDSMTTQAITGTILNMRKIAESPVITVNDGGNQKVADESVRQIFIDKYLKDFKKEIDKEYNKLKKPDSRLLTLGHDRLNQNQFTSQVHGANNHELYALIEAVAQKRALTEEQRSDLYRSILLEAEAKAEVCAQGFFNGISQAPIGLEEVVVSVESLMAKKDQENQAVQRATHNLLTGSAMTKMTQEIIEKIIIKNPVLSRTILDLRQVIATEAEYPALLDDRPYTEYLAQELKSRRAITSWLKGNMKQELADNFRKYQQQYMPGFTGQIEIVALQTAIFSIFDISVSKNARLVMDDNIFVEVLARLKMAQDPVIQKEFAMALLLGQSYNVQNSSVIERITATELDDMTIPARTRTIKHMEDDEYGKAVLKDYEIFQPYKDVIGNLTAKEFGVIKEYGDKLLIDIEKSRGLIAAAAMVKSAYPKVDFMKLDALQENILESQGAWTNKILKPHASLTEALNRPAQPTDELIQELYKALENTLVLKHQASR